MLTFELCQREGIQSLALSPLSETPRWSCIGVRLTTGNWSHDTDATTLCPTPLTLPLKVVCARNSMLREPNT